jgi:hypothetical protein
MANTSLDGNTERTQAEAFGDGMRSEFNSAVERAGRSANRLQDSFTGELAKKSMKETSNHLEAISSAGTELSQGFREIVREWMDFAKTRAENRQRWFSALAGCRTLPEFFEVQSRFWMNDVELLLASSERTAEISTSLARKATLSMVPAAPIVL